MTVSLGPVRLGRPRLGLALGSGGARGWVHLGILRALEAENIYPDLITGTSAGAVVGAFAAAGALDRLEEFASRQKSFRTTFNYMDFSLSDPGLIRGKGFIQFLDEYLKVRRFEELELPFGLIASNLVTLEEVHIFEGALIPALRATVAVPGFLPPQESGGMQLVDGGLLNPVPVSLARKLGADVVIGVDLNAHPAENAARSFGSVLTRSIEVMMNRIRLNNRHYYPADVSLEPRLPDYRFLDLHRVEEAMDEGRRVVAGAIDQIRSLREHHLMARDRSMRLPQFLTRRLQTVALKNTEDADVGAGPADSDPPADS